MEAASKSLQIARTPSTGDDKLIWTLEKCRKFSVYIAYRMISTSQAKIDSECSNPLQSFWCRLWKMTLSNNASLACMSRLPPHHAATRFKEDHT